MFHGEKSHAWHTYLCTSGNVLHVHYSVKYSEVLPIFSVRNKSFTIANTMHEKSKLSPVQHSPFTVAYSSFRLISNELENLIQQ